MPNVRELIAKYQRRSNCSTPDQTPKPKNSINELDRSINVLKSELPSSDSSINSNSNEVVTNKNVTPSPSTQESQVVCEKQNSLQENDDNVKVEVDEDINIKTHPSCGHTVKSSEDNKSSVTKNWQETSLLSNEETTKSTIKRRLAQRRISGAFKNFRSKISVSSSPKEFSDQPLDEIYRDPVYNCSDSDYGSFNEGITDNNKKTQDGNDENVIDMNVHDDKIMTMELSPPPSVPLAAVASSKSLSENTTLTPFLPPIETIPRNTPIAADDSTSLTPATQKGISFCVVLPMPVC